MADAVLTVRTDLPEDDLPKRATVAEVEYERELTSAEGPAKGASVREVVRAELPPSLDARVILPSAVRERKITFRLLDSRGVARVAREIDLTRIGSAEVVIDAADLAAMEPSIVRPERHEPNVVRRGKFIPIGGTFPFALTTLHVSPIALTKWKDLKALFNADEPRSMGIDIVPGAADVLGTVPWLPVHLTVAGGFEFAVPPDGFNAWLWWLAGPRQVVGVVVDTLREARLRTFAIPLPPAPVPVVAKRTPPREKDCCCPVPGRRLVPADVTETEVAENPALYTEDAGAYCKPFSNPERVVSERAFYTVFRVEQPLVSVEGATHTQGFTSVDFDPRLPRTGAQPARLLGWTARSQASAAPGTSPASNVATRLARYTLPAPLVEWMHGLTRGRSQLDPQHPIQWEDDGGRYQAATIARGHILEFRVRWRANGYSLGTVAKTLTLAPRQTRRVQKIEWERLETTRRAERTDLLDQVSDATTSERTYEDEVQANLSEWAKGSSKAKTTGGSGGLGFAKAGFVIGGGATSSTASGSSSQEGGRTTTATEEQRLRDSIRQFGDSLRRLESIVVNEVSEEETVIGTTEVIRNANYAHSLTVIYHQILRHLRIDTEIAGVRECLFVPLAILPFTIERAYRWRNTIQARLLDSRYLVGLRYLKDVLTNFESGEIPPGRRSDQPIVSMHGSLYINIAIERPPDPPEDVFDSALWQLLTPFLGVPPRAVFERIAARTAADRDAVFQKEFAPGIAAEWVTTLRLETSGAAPRAVSLASQATGGGSAAHRIPLSAEFTLATKYEFNGTVRVDFNVAIPPGGLTRERIASLRIRATSDLPAGSIANVTQITYEYQTDHFQRSVAGPVVFEHIIDPETGVRNTPGAQYTIVPTDWERQNLRAEASKAVTALVSHLNEYVEYYHKAIWWSMDRDRLFMLIDGFMVPGTLGVSVASVVERDPIAIVGNSLVFRIGAGYFLGTDELRTPAELHSHYLGNQPPRDPMYVSLPTDGLYAQTIMDECEALEEHGGNIDWVLDQPDPDLGALDPSLLLTRRAEPAPATPTPFPTTIINLPAAPTPPAPTGLQAALNAVTTANAFRDLANLAGTQGLAQASMEAATNLANSFGTQAASLEGAKIVGKAQAAASADKKIASIERAQKKGLLKPEEAQVQAQQVFKDLSAPVSESIPHQEPVIHETIRAASEMPGSVVEAATRDGTVKVSLGESNLATNEVGARGRDDPQATEADVESIAVLELGKWSDSKAFVAAMAKHGVADHTPAAHKAFTGLPTPPEEATTFWSAQPPGWWLDRFRAITPTWLYLSGHFLGSRLYNTADNFSLQFDPPTPENNVLWKYYTQEAEGGVFGLNDKCEAVLIVGCSAIEYPTALANMQQMLAHDGRAPVILGFAGPCPDDKSTDVQSTQFVAQLGKHWDARTDEKILADAWLVAAQAKHSVPVANVGYMGRDGRRFRAAKHGRSWRWKQITD